MFKRGTKAARISSQIWLFANNFFKHPAMLGSIVPSSPFLVNDVLAQVDWEKAEVLVEYGPGVGTITQEILKRMRPDAKLVVIELNPQFVDFLQNRIEDPRLHVVLGSASEARSVLANLNLARANYIISGIPYSLIPDPARREILESSPDPYARRCPARLPVHRRRLAPPEVKFRLRAAEFPILEHPSSAHF